MLTVERVATGEAELACFALRAAEYARFYRNIPPESFCDEFDSAKCLRDGPVSQLIAVRKDDAIVGTCRLVHSCRPGSPELRSEIAELMNLCWRDVSETVGVAAESLSVGELGKFAVTPGEDCQQIKWLLLTEIGIVAKEAGMNVVLALMPPLVERAARQVGVTFRRLNAEGLRRDDPDRMRFLLRYHDYFLPTFRKQGIDIDVDQLDAAHPTALQMLLSGAADGPALWWISPAELAAAQFPRSLEEKLR